MRLFLSMVLLVGCPDTTPTRVPPLATPEPIQLDLPRNHAGDSASDILVMEDWDDGSQRWWSPDGEWVWQWREDGVYLHAHPWLGWMGGVRVVPNPITDGETWTEIVDGRTYTLTATRESETVWAIDVVNEDRATQVRIRDGEPLLSGERSIEVFVPTLPMPVSPVLPLSPGEPADVPFPLTWVEGPWGAEAHGMLNGLPRVWEVAAGASSSAGSLRVGASGVGSDSGRLWPGEGGPIERDRSGLFEATYETGPIGTLERGSFGWPLQTGFGATRVLLEGTWLADNNPLGRTPVELAPSLPERVQTSALRTIDGVEFRHLIATPSGLLDEIVMTPDGFDRVRLGRVDLPPGAWVVDGWFRLDDIVEVRVTSGSDVLVHRVDLSGAGMDRVPDVERVMRLDTGRTGTHVCWSGDPTAVPQVYYEGASQLPTLPSGPGCTLVVTDDGGPIDSWFAVELPHLGRRRLHTPNSSNPVRYFEVPMFLPNHEVVVRNGSQIDHHHLGGAQRSVSVNAPTQGPLLRAVLPDRIGTYVFADRLHRDGRVEPLPEGVTNVMATGDGGWISQDAGTLTWSDPDGTLGSVPFTPVLANQPFRVGRTLCEPNVPLCWDLDTGAELGAITAWSATSYQPSPDGTQFVTSHPNGFTWYDADTLEVLRDEAIDGTNSQHVTALVTERTPGLCPTDGDELTTVTLYRVDPETLELLQYVWLDAICDPDRTEPTIDPFRDVAWVRLNREANPANGFDLIPHHVRFEAVLP